ncbi:hypothetical protein [Mucilaginibacter segetis]|uniref:Uncharacterized protein n=1 Tax=Mucilaginibacter segetis TaxID=2793071 RepID=A0A934PQW3_9SPHI|nr:hypothetical protein [Mucilaginibacter segetis]MBK0379099.1 hypothetical protein [Mucilaginibacter segetis]
MRSLTPEQKLHYILRLAIAMCFIGHGAFGIITKQIWCNYFAVFGFDMKTSYILMPWVGVFDIFLGLTMLVYPIRAIAIWLVLWGAVTAFLRPLSGEPFAEFLERGGNFGAPLAFLILSGNTSTLRQLFARVEPPAKITAKTIEHLTLCLRVVVFSLLVGHGWLNLLSKKSLLAQYASLGFLYPARIAQYIGIIEVAGACIVIMRPFCKLLLVLFIWKVISELFYPRYEVFEWIERGGSYCSILALWFALQYTSSGINVRFWKRSIFNNIFLL